MKIFILYMLITYVSAATNVLFLGNSFTGRKMPKFFKKIARKFGEKVNIESYTPGGVTWYYHSLAPKTEELINSKHWDAVVLQEQSSLLSLPGDVYYRQSLGPLRALAYKLRNQTDQIVLFQTHAYYYGFDVMQQRLIEGYNAAERSINTSFDDVRVARAGEKWRVAKDYFGMRLYKMDLRHPSTLGNYLDACVMYETIFNKSIYKLRFKPRGVSKKDKKKILQVLKTDYEDIDLYDFELYANLNDVISEKNLLPY